MDFKNELRELVEIVKLNSKKAGGKLTNEEIAKRLGYSRPYFSTLIGTAGKVEKDHIDNFKSRFRDELEGKFIKPSLPGDVLNRERALIKVLFHRVVKLEAQRLGMPEDKVIAEMERDTNIALADLEQL